MSHVANNIRRSAFSLMELMAVVAIVSLLAALAIPRIGDTTDSGNRTACHVNRAEIEVQARLWKRAAGTYPAANLSDIGADLNYFPEGVPTCPLDGTTYTIDPTTGEVIGHDH